eukprot:6714198-Pyramimonas_sp.AAC.1
MPHNNVKPTCGIIAGSAVYHLEVDGKVVDNESTNVSVTAATWPARLQEETSPGSQRREIAGLGNH